MVAFTYPADIYELLKEKWHQKRWKEDVIPPLPNRAAFRLLLDVVYHASFLTEERRRIWFRVVYMSPKEIRSKKWDDKVLREDIGFVEFDTPRPFGVSELVKLAPAADPTQVLIGVTQNKSEKPEIWGLVETGTSWWDFRRHEATYASPPPNAFTVSSKRPGQISISRGGDEILTLEQGMIITPSMFLFYEGPLGNFLERGTKQLYNEVCKRLKADCWDPEKQDDDYPKRFYISFLQRILNRIRERFHGGTVLMIPDDINITDTRLSDRVSIKYTCQDETWKLLVNELVEHNAFYGLLFKLWNKKTVSQDEFSRLQSAESRYEEAQEMVKRAAAVLSSLSAVDGAVVLTHKLRLLGFGAEIIAQSPSLKKVKVVTDPTSGKGEYRRIEHFGTRHRSAFRFCSSFEDSAAFIVSQDGDIRVAKRVGSEVFLWSNISVALT